ncbi:hypothetical protein AGABI2DRAFT_207679 [Agaricus bisporus var. bisporus H97]|uniref:hypothetical protein n=1 Tax=Agaricus bisporus var. bisporus (strain H97 / ATCC MYA-4626 / FGSC 10389) TaxID=936046 RepID=UPI00029F5C63|nr:hypothetical protein AGABI2DRAFT_207679 [Agaricus bisporus var. bisporus H97]EKV46167.1 hypothetical protein AGABI2DRAFT_207679 [Agaricus bisporus var. bisporus H97]
MKIVAALLACLTATRAQHVLIGYPPEGANLTAGHTTTIEIQRPNFQSSSEEVAIVLGITSCPNTLCPAPADTMGHILHNGPFDPKEHPLTPLIQPYQNFTVELPGDLPKGKAQLNVYHVALIGESFVPFNETLRTSVFVK